MIIRHCKMQEENPEFQTKDPNWFFFKSPGKMEMKI